jgi:hypothetical protein
MMFHQRTNTMNDITTFTHSTTHQGTTKLRGKTTRHMQQRNGQGLLRNQTVVEEKKPKKKKPKKKNSHQTLTICPSR